MAKLTIAGIQFHILDGDFDDNCQRVVRTIEDVAGNGVDLICFPELCFTGPDVNNIEEDASTLPAKIRNTISAIAIRYKAWILPGTYYCAYNGVVKNRAEVFNASGEIVARYDKRHPWAPYEKTSPGNRTVVFDLAGKSKAGISICYDMWFPEQVRDLIRQGAEIILHPSLTSTADRKQELILCQAHAIMNQCYFIDINGSGVGVGESMIVGPQGEILAQAGVEKEILIVELDLDYLREVRETGTEGVTLTWKHFMEGLD